MDCEVEQLLRESVDDLVKLEITLFYHQNPAFVDGAEAIARRIYRDQGKVEVALECLVKAGLLDRFQLGSGRYVLYSYTQDHHLRSVIAMLNTCYHENDADRNEIIRWLMKVGRPPAGAPSR